MTSPHLSAIETASQLAAGSLDATALVRETLARIEAQDAQLGAFVAVLDSADALAQLKVLRAQGGPLQGLPVAVKDIFNTTTLPTRYGSAIYPSAPSRCDAAMVSVIRRAGGLVIGKSSTTEFAFLNPTATLNPNAPGHTPGGSSAGSAAAVAAGLVPFAVGTQTGGSIIRPASYCGVSALKPTFGMLPTSGFKSFSWSLDTVGLFAATVRELAWFAEAVTGHTLALSPLADSTQVSALNAATGKPWVVAVPDGYPWGPLSASAQKAMDSGSDAWRALGAEIKRVTFPSWMKAVYEAHDAIQGYEAWRALAPEFDRAPEALSSVLRNYLMASSHVTAADYQAAQNTAAAGRSACDEWFKQFDVLMAPSAPDEAPAGYSSTGASTHNRAWTLLGTPCVNVTGATGVTGLPMGLTLITAQRADQTCLIAADVLERALGHHA